MNITKLEHYLVRTHDLEGTKQFYTELLGLKEGWRAPFPFPGYWLYIGETPCVHLVAVDNDPARADYLSENVVGRGSDAQTVQGTGALDHLGFRADGLQESLKRLKAGGVEPRVREVGELTQVFFEDPNGITIELNFVTADELSAAKPASAHV